MKLLIMSSVVLTSILFLSACASAKRPVSDHFDGKKFHNLPPTPEKGFWDVIKWRWTRQPVDWPAKIQVTVQDQITPITANKSLAITFVNHSTFLIQTQNYNFLTDPIWSDRTSPVQWAGPKRIHAPGIKFESLPPIHYVMVSHNHYDHMDADTLKRLDEKFKPQVLVPLGDKKTVEKFGVTQAHELDWWDEVKINDDIKIIFTRCQHWSARGLGDRNESLWGSFILFYKGKKIYFAGDTGYADHFREIVNRYGPMDLSFLPIGAYEPRYFMKDHHMNPVEAVQAHLDLQSKKSIAMHYGTFQLSDEGQNQPLEDLKKALQEKNLPQDTFIALPVGSTFQLE